MARITVEDCLTKENNRFALVQLASKRTKQLLQGSRVLSSEAKGNKAVVTALREIAEGQVRFMTDDDRKIIEALERQKEITKPSPSDLFIPAAPLPTNGGIHAVDDIEDEDDAEIDVDDIEDIDDEDDDEAVVVDDSDDSDDEKVDADPDTEEEKPDEVEDVKE